MFLEHREILTHKCHVPEHDCEIEFGKASVVRAGTDVTVVALAKMVPVTLSLCDLLQKENISVELIDPRTISPLDTATILQSVAKTGRLIVEDNARSLWSGSQNRRSDRRRGVQRSGCPNSQSQWSICPNTVRAVAGGCCCADGKRKTILQMQSENWFANSHWNARLLLFLVSVATLMDVADKCFLGLLIHFGLLSVCD